jgi:hypothetical protein
MASKRALRRKACLGKVRYTKFTGPGSAWESAWQYNSKHIDKIYPYRCGSCGGVHNGHTPKKMLLNPNIALHRT